LACLLQADVFTNNIFSGFINNVNQKENHIMGNSSPEVQAIAERWNGFLKKIEARYYEVLQQTEAPLDGVIGNIQYDNVIIHNIANGLKNQTVTQLSEKPMRRLRWKATEKSRCIE
jgi:hypothetical protein